MNHDTMEFRQAGKQATRDSGHKLGPLNGPRLCIVLCPEYRDTVINFQSMAGQ
jgi:hypothetical protein